jgi:HPt (histidine-containing phosphotransfer) domain-containing protein
MENQATAVPPVLDCEQLDGLIAAAGVEGAKSILDAFWRSTENLLASLQRQISEGDLNAAARTAHALKGSSLNVGALRLSSAARAIEDACRKADAGGALEKSCAARSDYDVTVVEFQKHLAA